MNVKDSTHTPLSQSCVSQGLTRIRRQCQQLMDERQDTPGMVNAGELALEVDHSFNPYDSGA